MAARLPLVIVLICVSFSQIQSHSNLQSACELAVDSESCRSSLLQNPKSSKADPKDLTKISVEMSLAHVEKIHNLIPPISWVSRAFNANHSRAIQNCLTFYDLALDHMKAALSKLKHSGNTSLQMKIAVGIQTLLSAAATNQRTCLEGLQQANVNISQFTFARDIHNASRSVSNCLAVINKLWIAGKAPVRHYGRLLSDGFPGWLSRVDKRRILGSSGISVDVTVSQDGSGKYNKISDAINGAPENSPERYVIYVKKGEYKENIKLPFSKTNIMLVGDGVDATVVTGNRGVGDGWSMLDTATLVVFANGFLARDITFANTAGPSKDQAPAVMVQSDMSAFYRCKFMGFQDTLYAHSLRQFYRECDIYGTIDFICGNAAAVFQKCNILVRKPLSGQQNVITASQRSTSNENTGIVIQDSKVTASPEISTDSFVRTYLGRPWGTHARSVYMNTDLGALIDPQGWMAWPGSRPPTSIYFGEYQNTGPGARTSQRIKWPGCHLAMNGSDAQQFTASDFLNSDQWLPTGGVPFQANLS